MGVRGTLHSEVKVKVSVKVKIRFLFGCKDTRFFRGVCGIAGDEGRLYAIVRLYVQKRGA